MPGDKVHERRHAIEGYRVREVFVTGSHKLCVRAPENCEEKRGAIVSRVLYTAACLCTVCAMCTVDGWMHESVRACV